jgi:hypothetical protein
MLLKTLKKAIGIKPDSAVTPCASYGYSCNCDLDIFECAVSRQQARYCMPYDYTFGVSCGSTVKTGCCAPILPA